jgi:hypothetical protein
MLIRLVLINNRIYLLIIKEVFLWLQMKTMI